MSDVWDQISEALACHIRLELDVKGTGKEFREGCDAFDGLGELVQCVDERAHLLTCRYTHTHIYIYILLVSHKNLVSHIQYYILRTVVEFFHL